MAWPALPFWGPGIQPPTRKLRFSDDELPAGTSRQVKPLPGWPDRLRAFPRYGTPGITVSSGYLLEVDAQFRALTARGGDGRMVGFLLQHLDGPEPGCLVLQVDPERQRRGIGRALWVTAEVLGWEPTLDGQRLTVEGEAWARAVVV